MAVTVGTVTAAEEAVLNAGKILFVGTNALRRRNATPVWSSSGSWADSGTAGVGANLDDASYPTRYLYDDLLYNYTQPAVGAVGLSTAYILLDLVDGTDDDQTIDAVWLKPINWHLMDGSVTATLEVADNSAFTTNLRTVTTFAAWDSDAKAIDVRIGLDYVSCSPYRVPIARLAAAQRVGAVDQAAHAGRRCGGRCGSVHGFGLRHAHCRGRRQTHHRFFQSRFVWRLWRQLFLEPHPGRRQSA